MPFTFSQILIRSGIMCLFICAQTVYMMSSRCFHLGVCFGWKAACFKINWLRDKQDSFKKNLCFHMQATPVCVYILGHKGILPLTPSFIELDVSGRTRLVSEVVWEACWRLSRQTLLEWAFLTFSSSTEEVRCEKNVQKPTFTHQAAVSNHRIETAI